MQNAEKDLAARAKNFARRIIRLCIALPKATVAQVLGKQVLRSETSVGANYREASRGRSKAEFISKVGDCLKKADKTACWLELLADRQLFPGNALSRCSKKPMNLFPFSSQFQSARAAIDFCILHSAFCL
jgi:four helix bundle protein